MSAEYQKDGVKIGLLAAEDPPPKRTGNRERQEAIAKLLPLLKEQKGTWFRIGEYPKKTSAGSAAGTLRKHYGDYEWEPRANSNGSVLYGRYVGKTKR